MVGSDVWGLVARRAKGGLWRLTYGDNEVGLSDAEYEARRPAAVTKMLPGHPGPGEYRITQTDHFRIHNRCVETMRVGRVLLAGDAAHVNNPFGGYGAMNTILDVGGLAECLIGVYEGKAGDEILDLYAQVRRDKFLKYVDARSMKNMKRIIDPDPHTTLEGDKLMDILRELEGDSEGTKAFLLVSIARLRLSVLLTCNCRKLRVSNTTSLSTTMTLPLIYAPHELHLKLNRKSTRDGCGCFTGYRSCSRNGCRGCASVGATTPFQSEDASATISSEKE